jgi:hypothetical protein
MFYYWFLAFGSFCTFVRPPGRSESAIKLRSLWLKWRVTQYQIRRFLCDHHSWRVYVPIRDTCAAHQSTFFFALQRARLHALGMTDASTTRKPCRFTPGNQKLTHKRCLQRATNKRIKLLSAWPYLQSANSHIAGIHNAHVVRAHFARARRMVCRLSVPSHPCQNFVRG